MPKQNQQPPAKKSKDTSSRAGRDYEMRTSHGLTNVPQPGDVGSAAYRRLQRSRTDQARRK